MVLTAGMRWNIMQDQFSRSVRDAFVCIFLFFLYIYTYIYYIYFIYISLAHVREYISDCLALLAPNLPLTAEERLAYVDQIVSHAPNVKFSLPFFIFYRFNFYTNSSPHLLCVSFHLYSLFYLVT